MDKITHCEQADVFEMKIQLILPPKSLWEGRWKCCRALGQIQTPMFM
jgi:hypothetical protein